MAWLPIPKIKILNISGEYRGLIGEHIPYRKFGYYNLHELLDGARDYCRVVFNSDGSIDVKAKVQEETAHLAEVRKQVYKLFGFFSPKTESKVPIC